MPQFTRLTTEQDADLVLLCQHAAGNPDAVGELFRRHRERLWAVAVRTLGDREEAAGTQQDAMIAASDGPETFVAPRPS